MTTEHNFASTAVVQSILAPESIAIVGASSDATKFNGRIIPTLVRHGYPGIIYPVNPRSKSVNGIRCYKTVSEIPDQVDHVIIGVGRDHVMPILQQCRSRGVKSVSILTSGFAELDEEGKRLQREMVAFSQETGIRLVGPNCMGSASLVSKTLASTAAAFAHPTFTKGNIAIVSQSGGLSQAAVLYPVLMQSIGLSHVVHTGNEADLQMADFINAFVDDPDTKVIMVTAEGFSHPDRFLAACKRAAEAGKPIVMLKIGRSEVGQRAAISHTGSLTGSDQVNDAVFKQHGILRVDDYDELYETANLLAKTNLPKKRGVSVLSISGGMLALTSDLGGWLGIQFPEFTPSTQAAIKALVPDYVSPKNPLDMTTAVISNQRLYRDCMEHILKDEEIDVVIPIMTVAPSYDSVIDDVVSLKAETEKNIVVLWTGGQFMGEGFPRLERSPVPIFRTPLKLMKALGRMFEYADFQQSRQASAPLAGINQPRQAAARQLLAGKSGVLTEADSKQLLALYDLPVTAERLATDAAAAVDAAESIGYPVALKIQSVELPHKTEADVIRLNLKDAAAVREGFAQVMANALKVVSKDAVDGVLVQEMASGTELILGVSTDPTYGKVVMLGLGGILTEVMKDVAFRLPPFSKSDSLAMLSELKGQKVLNGTRGKPAVDREVLAEVAARLSELAVELDDLITEVDINPITAGPRGIKIVDGLVVLRGGK